MLSSFDEDDVILNEELGRSIATVASKILPPRCDFNGESYSVKCVSALQIPSSLTERFLELLEKCIGNLYVKIKGAGWKSSKLEEMTDPALVYFWCERDAEIAAFMSFRMVSEPYGQSLYLYEIHVDPRYQGQSRGTQLIQWFHLLAYSLNELSRIREISSDLDNLCDNLRDQLQKNGCEIDSAQLICLSRLPQSIHFQSAGTGLTVFGENAVAFRWYTSLGYLLSSQSPCDRLLRNGRVVRPEYYILYRPQELEVLR
ncbi:hypothetical protein PUMCH_001932 [Australozyma saopauloensis]|uniref:N-alpha-acetyltransferase 40 n=1 Tax=Australozyma saopauloensis TaxID=291208 RepID=A0AAX4H845_9ASCO|nr:hypothetical protein PUMCH_001932 [[Candida] saopauloensis]